MRRSTALLALSPAFLALGLPSTADAAPASRVTINETLDFENESFTFTESGPLCPSGTFEDEVVKATAFQSEMRVNLTIDTVYTCDDGSGEFFVRKHVNILDFETFTTSSGPVKFVGGTGDYDGQAGHGSDVGTDPGPPTPATGTITGFVVHP